MMGTVESWGGPTPFATRLPDMLQWPLMIMDFVVGSRLAGHNSLLFGPSSSGRQLRSTLLPDPPRGAALAHCFSSPSSGR
jgi:hypothetical protein